MFRLNTTLLIHGRINCSYKFRLASQAEQKERKKQIFLASVTYLRSQIYKCIIIIIIVVIQQAVQCFHIFLRPYNGYRIFHLQLCLSLQSSSASPFSPIPSAQVSLGLPRFLLPAGRHFITSNVFYIILIKDVGRGSSVGIATRYGLDGPEIESRWGQHFPHPSRPALGHTQPPIQ